VDDDAHAQRVIPVATEPGCNVIRHFLNPPNWFTAASIFCSVYALTLLVGPGEITPALLSQAATLVVFGGIFDMMDGRVARLTNRFSEFGVQLDSIADMVGFGLAPAVLVYAWSLHELGAIGVAAAVWYAVSAAFRLARFNVNASERTWSFAGHSQGLTSTMAGGSLVTLVWVCNDYLAGVLVPPAWFVALLTCVIGFLMISSVPFRNFKDLRDNRVARRLLAVFFASCLGGAVVLHPSMWFGTGAALYLAAGLVDGLVVAVYHRRLAAALLLEDEDDGELYEEDEQPVSRS
jgi:CDP-diacylglycerol--serine O-phosphatidyltransferase